MRQRVLESNYCGRCPFLIARNEPMQPNGSGNSGLYLSVLNCALENGLSFETYGREWLFVSPTQHAKPFISNSLNARRGFEQLPHLGPELGDGEWLDEITRGTGFFGVRPVRRRLASADHQDGDVPQLCRRPDELADLVAADLWKHQVKTDNIRRLFAQLADGRATIAHLDHPQADFLQVLADELAQHDVILDEESSPVDRLHATTSDKCLPQPSYNGSR